MGRYNKLDATFSFLREIKKKQKAKKTQNKTKTNSYMSN